MNRIHVATALIAAAVMLSCPSQLVAQQASTAAPGSAEQLLPGQWKTTQTIQGPRSERPLVRTQCLSLEQLQAQPVLPMILTLPARDDATPEACTVDALSMTAGAVSFQTHCPGPRGQMSGAWQGRFSGDSFSVTGKLKMGFISANGQLVGERLGACPSD